jgi:hypothetical protein
MALRNEKRTPNNDSSIEKDFYEQNILDMSRKLAVISVDYLKNKIISSKTLARCQQSDAYLSQIYELCLNNKKRIYENYHLTNKVLFKRIWDSNLEEFKHCIALPDVLLPSVIHYLHHHLAHPSASTTLKNFQSYYYNRVATRAIKEYVRNCMTCSMAGKIDVFKVASGNMRTMNPDGPRQCLYVDLLPCPKGKFSFILFCVDAYSQYLMTIPLKDKGSDSVYQGLISIMSVAGPYKEIYFDNESSFQRVAQELVKMIPIKVHFSVPYAHFQNSAETHIKIFKKCLMKVLFDDDNQNSVSINEWEKVLPTVTQSINRQLILSLGLTRESLHFNTLPNNYPLDHIHDETKLGNLDAFNIFEKDFFKKNLNKKLKKYLKSNKNRIPVFEEQQLVMLKDKKQENQYKLFQIPYKGPFKIVKLEPRNVKLLDLTTGKETNSHIEFLKPLSLREFKLIINDRLRLDNVILKHSKKDKVPPDKSALDQIEDVYNLDQIFRIEQSQNLDQTNSLNDSESISQEIEDIEDPLEGPSTLFNATTVGSLEKLCDEENSTSKENYIEDKPKRIKFKALLTKVFK